MRKAENDSALKLMIIKTKDKVFVSDNVKGAGYFHTQLSKLLFDGAEVKETFNKDWFEINQIPIEITERKPAKEVNHRYELKEGFNETELTPKVIHARYIDEDSEYYEVKGLYDRKYETEEAGFEIVPFEIHQIEEVEGNFEITKNQYNPQYNLLDRIQTHPALLALKPCELTKEESYKIIRSHVKANIDPKYARISSDYDFCFTVEKVIDLYQPESYTVNLNSSYPRRKPKYETRFKNVKTMKIYEAAPKAYNSYPVVESFVGNNLEDLESNIELFLDELMEKINEPIKECECCKGRGVIVNEN